MTPDAFARSLASQVVYQIFPDRFAVGRSPEGKCFDGAPERGDLDGIAERLDYLADLGVTTVYTTPIFQSPSSHKYDATDFFEVDRGFGGEAAFERLLASLHGRGMKWILDAVLNHVSDRHPWFQEAHAGTGRERFSFLPDGRCRCWKDHTSLPELNLDCQEVRDALYRRPDSLVQGRLARGIDGWRFDVAQDVGLAVAEELGAIVRERFPEAWLVGELWGFGGDWLKSGRGFHGLMNYYLRTALLSWLGGEIDSRQVDRAMADMLSSYGLEGLLCSWNLLSSHDTPRLRTVLGDAGRIRLAWLAQMTLPGVPVIYYGEEIGMEGGADPDNRRSMPWSEAEWDQELRRWVKHLIGIRQRSPELQYGDVILLGDHLPGNALAFLRHTERLGEAALVILNPSAQGLRARLLLPYSHWYDGVPLRDVLETSPETVVQGGAVDLEIAPRSGAIYRAYEPFEGYRFFKER